MINALHLIAERKISKAISEGTLQTDGWKNKPLPMEDDRLVPADLKMAYKILKNSGYLPPEIEAKKEIQRLEELISRTEDEHTRLRQMKKLNVLMIKYGLQRSGGGNIEAQEEYYKKVVERISVRDKTSEP
ncbi:MAG: DUF1992 domain-containing protein [Desulfobulbaceae bacterium]|nr:DUF1992 domain-containing protein [Desulfobulbaceae bacterium]MCK5405172.1 DUF1992 domain-containing protein [Desulfobulbaceae bacterium]